MSRQIFLALPKGYRFEPEPSNPGLSAYVFKGAVYIGPIWTFRNTRTEFHPWHGLRAERFGAGHRAFYSQEGGKRAAVEFVTSAAAGV